MSEKNHKDEEYQPDCLEIEKRYFPCLEGDDGTFFFLSTPLTRLSPRREEHRSCQSTPNSYSYWQEVKHGDTIIEFNETKTPISTFTVCRITNTYILALYECKNKELFKLYNIKGLPKFYEIIEQYD